MRTSIYKAKLQSSSVMVHRVTIPACWARVSIHMHAEHISICMRSRLRKVLLNVHTPRPIFRATRCLAPSLRKNYQSRYVRVGNEPRHHPPLSARASVNVSERSMQPFDPLPYACHIRERVRGVGWTKIKENCDIAFKLWCVILYCHELATWHSRISGQIWRHIPC